MTRGNKKNTKATTPARYAELVENTPLLEKWARAGAEFAFPATVILMLYSMLSPQLAQNLSPAASFIISGLGVNFFADIVSKFRHARDNNDLSEIKDLIRQANLEQKLSDNDFQDKMRMVLSDEIPLLVAEMLHSSAENTALVILNALRDQEQLLTSKAVEQLRDFAIANQKLLRAVEEFATRYGVLSRHPLTSRVSVEDIPIVGRTEELEWLHQRGDKVVVGQPGAGKTFLLQKFVKETNGYFVLDSNYDSLVKAIKHSSPQTLVVDDASPRMTSILVHIRKDVGIEFDIVAACWPSDAIKVAESLQSPSTKHLASLVRDDIVAIIKSIGLLGPNALLQEIVKQAVGLPGLAVTLAHACRDGNIQSLVRGDKLYSVISDNLGEDGQAELLLAIVAVGGDSGMFVKDIARLAAMSELTVLNILKQIQPSGFIRESRETVAIRLAALRAKLVGLHFFREGGSLSVDIKPYIESVPNHKSAIQGLINAKSRGEAVPDRILLEYLNDANSPELWEEFAYIGIAYAEIAFDTQPRSVRTNPNPFLSYLPERTIPLLLEASLNLDINDRFPDRHPASWLNKWIKEGDPRNSEAFLRRQTLFQSSRKWLESIQNPLPTHINLFISSLEFLTNPSFERTSRSPGSALTLIIEHGYVFPKDMGRILELWRQAMPVLRRFNITNWKLLQRIVGNWIYDDPRLEPNQDASKLKVEITHEILEGILELSCGHIGIAYWVSTIAQQQGLQLSVNVDPDICVLYPHIHGREWRAGSSEYYEAVDILARKWKELPCEQVVQRICEIERAASDVGMGWPRLTPELCARLAQIVDDPVSWISVMLEKNVSGQLIDPFLCKAYASRATGWKEVTLEMLERVELRQWPLMLALSQDDFPVDLIPQVMDKIDGHGKTIEICYIQDKITNGMLENLWNSDKPEILTSLVQVDCHSGRVSDDAQYARQRNNTIVKYLTDNDLLCELLGQNGDLAFLWLNYHLMDSDEETHFHPSDVFSSAIQALNANQRRQVLTLVPDSNSFMPSELIADLVGDDINMYKEILSDPKFSEFCYVPLRGPVTNSWLQKAKLALEYSLSINDIVRAFYGRFHTWVGNESDDWQYWVSQFELICNSDDPQVRKIGQHGKIWASHQRDIARKREREQSVYGDD